MKYLGKSSFLPPKETLNIIGLEISDETSKTLDDAWEKHWKVQIDVGRIVGNEIERPIMDAMNFLGSFWFMIAERVR